MDFVFFDQKLYWVSFIRICWRNDILMVLNKDFQYIKHIILSVTSWVCIFSILKRVGVELHKKRQFSQISQISCTQFYFDWAIIFHALRGEFFPNWIEFIIFTWTDIFDKKKCRLLTLVQFFSVWIDQMNKEI